MAECTMTLTLTRTEAHQALLIIANRLDETRNALLDTDYATKYGQAVGEQVKHDDQKYAHELQMIVAKLIDAL